MSWKIVSEVLDHAPASLSPAERLVLVALAEWSTEPDRKCWRPVEQLQQRTGLSPSGLRATLGRLAAQGLDPRVPLSVTDTGRRVYSRTGRTTTYRVPQLDPPGGCSCQQCRASGDASVSPGGDAPVSPVGGVVTPERASGDTPVSKWRHPGVTQSVPTGSNRGGKRAPAPATPAPPTSAPVGEQVTGTDGYRVRRGDGWSCRCAEHAHLSVEATVPPCTACGAVAAANRNRTQAADAEFAAAARRRRAAIDSCGLCGPEGFREHPETRLPTREECDHRPRSVGRAS